MDLLIPSTGLLFWMTLVFLIVLLIMWRFGFPVISKMVIERKRYIDESLKQAHEANEKLANIQKEGEAILLQAREKQATILKEAKQAHDIIVAKAENDAKVEAEKLISEAKALIETEKTAAIRDIRKQVAELSVVIAEKVIRQNLSSQDAQMQLIDSLLDEVAKDK